MREKSIATIQIGLLISVAFMLALYAKAPASNGATTTSSTINVSITISDGSSGGGGGGGPNDNPADVDFVGFASPKATVSISSDGAIIGSALADTSGEFFKSVQTNSGFATFYISAKDAKGLTTATTTITINLNPGSRTKISNIFLSPTIQGESDIVEEGSTIRISGSTYPGSDVRIFRNIPHPTLEATVKATPSGDWEYLINTQGLSEGDYTYNANAQFTEIKNAIPVVSEFSNKIQFTVGQIVCQGADFNEDGGINLSDFSIMLFYWGPIKNPATLTNICVDLTKDKFVDIFDFSVLMYEWTS